MLLIAAATVIGASNLYVMIGWIWYKDYYFVESVHNFLSDFYQEYFLIIFYLKLLKVR
jgi:hypothetical protein